MTMTFSPNAATLAEEVDRFIGGLEGGFVANDALPVEPVADTSSKKRKKVEDDSVRTPILQESNWH